MKQSTKVKTNSKIKNYYMFDVFPLHVKSKNS